MASIAYSSPTSTAAPELSVGQVQANRLLPELGVLAAASLLCLALYWAGDYGAVALLAPLVLIVVNALANFRMIVADPAMLMTPLFGARLIAMVVFGVGGLFHALAPADAQLSMDWLYVASAEEVAKVNLLWLLSMTLLIGGAALAMQFHRRKRGTPVDHGPSRAVPLNIGLWMFALSFTVHLTRFILELITPIVVPGIIDTLLLAFELCGIFLVAQHIGTSRAALFAICFGIGALILAGLLFQTKTLALYPLLVAMLGMFTSRVTWRRAIASATAIVLIFMVISPIVAYARQRMSLEYSMTGSGSLSDRWRYIVDYAEGDRISDDFSVSTLMRLDYVVPASFVITQFDQGLPSDALANSAYIFIPRLIWPDKPSTSDSGIDVNHLLGSQTTNQIGTTVFAFLYWNIGWYSLAIAIAIGMYCGIVSIMCQSIMRRGEWLLFPFCLVSMRLGLNLDNDFTAGWMAPAVINLVLYLALSFAARFLRVLPGVGAGRPVIAVPR